LTLEKFPRLRIGALSDAPAILAGEAGTRIVARCS
jgi:hypothetical protein